MLGVIIAIIFYSSLLMAWCKNVDFTSARFIVFTYFVVCHFVKRFIITFTRSSLLNS